MMILTTIVRRLGLSLAAGLLACSSAVFAAPAWAADAVTADAGERSEASEGESDPSETLAAARELFELVDYEEAAELYLIVAEDSRATREERIEAWSSRAICLAGLDHEEGAAEAFVEVLDLDPSYELPEMVSPKIREAFERATQIVVARPPEDPGVEPMPYSPPARAARAGPSTTTWAAIIGAGAVGTLATGGIFGGLAGRGETVYNEEPDRFESQQDALDYRETVLARARTANILYATGAVLTAGALTLYFMDGMGGNGGGGLGAGGSFRMRLDAGPGGGVLGVEARW